MTRSEWPQKLSRLLRLLLLLGGEGASVSVFFQEAIVSEWVSDFVARNILERSARDLLIIWAVVGAVVPCLAALIVLLIGRRNPGTLPRIEQIARLLAPALVLWAVPALVIWRPWANRDLALLVTASLAVIAVERSARVSFKAAEELELGRRLRIERMRVFLRKIPALLPHFIVGAAAVGYAAYFSYYTVLNHHRLGTANLDLGYFDSLFWNAMHGRPFYAPSAHDRAGSYLAIHAEFLLYPLLPIYMIVPRAETLLILQSTLCGLSAIPLYLFGRRRLGSNAMAAVVAVALMFYPPMHGPNFYDFHFLTISVFFVLWAAYFFDTERHVLFWVTFVLCLLCREDVPLGFIATGTALVLSGHRVKSGFVMAGVASVYMVIVKFVVMAHYGEPSFLYVYKDLVAPGEKGFSSVLRTLFMNPIYTVSTFLDLQKLTYALQIFVPLAFLPLRRKVYWFLLFPGFFVTLLSTGYLPVIQIRFQYGTHFTPYVFLGAVLVLEAMKKGDAVHKARAAALGLAAGTVFMTCQYGALQQEHFFGGFSKIEFEITDEERERLARLREIIQTIPKDASVSTSERTGPHLAGRQYMFALKDAVQGADYILYAYRDLGINRTRPLVREALQSKEFGLHAEMDDFVVLRKGAPTDRNDELLRKLR